MNVIKTGLILALLSACTLISGCGGGANSNNVSNGLVGNTANDASSSAKTNVEELGLLINMPYDAEEIVWKEDTQHKKVIAVLRFSPEDSKKLVAEAEKIKTPEKVTLSTQTWFPPELIAQGGAGGEDTVEGRAYAANAFFQPPYSEGRITRVEDSDYFVLEVTAK
jgi:hypothetical protein